MHAPEYVSLSRDVDAVMIPDGTLITLTEGTPVRIHQSLGGSYTVTTERGYMARINGRDADALGREVEEIPLEATGSDRESVERNAWAAMKRCYDPEIPVNIVDLGLVYSCQVTEVGPERHRVEVEMTLTAPGCGMGPILQSDVERGIRDVPGVEAVEVEVVFEPMWSPHMMSEAARLELGM
jgi:probable FeS assembly SUF system protein SufT